MDLEELNDNLQTGLAEIQNQITDLKNNMQTSRDSNELTLIFSKLNEFEKMSEECLRNNAEEMNRNATSVYNEWSNSASLNLNELKESVRNAQSEMKNQMATVADSVGSKVSRTVKAVEKSCIEANRIFCDSVKSGKSEIQKAVTEQRKAILKSWANVLLFILVGGICSFLGIFGWNFFKIQDGFYKELAESKKLESIQNEAVKKYKAEIIADKKHKEIDRLIENWNKKNK